MKVLSSFFILVLVGVFFISCGGVEDPNDKNQPVYYGVPAVPTLAIINYSANSVYIEWNNVSFAKGYLVYTNINSSNSSFNLAGSSFSNTFSISGIDNNSTYYFRVSATNEYGESQLSEPLSIINDTIPPTIVVTVPSSNVCLTRWNDLQVTCSITDNTRISNAGLIVYYNNQTNYYGFPNPDLNFYIINLVEGTNDAVLSVEDIYKNKTNYTITIIKDSIPPIITNLVFSTTDRTTNDVIVWAYASGATNIIKSNICTGVGYFPITFYDQAGNSVMTNIYVDWVDRSGPGVRPLYTRNYNDRVRLKWEIPSASDYNKIEIYRKSDIVPASGSVEGMSLIFTGSNEIEYDDSTVVTGTKYYYVAVTYDDLGNKSIGKISYAYFPFLDMRQWYNFAREDIGLAYYDNKIYMMGGYRTSYGGSIWTVQRYDLITDTVTEISHLMNVLVWFQGNVVSNRIFVFGGGWIESRTESFDIAGNTWGYATPLPHAASDIVSLVHNDQIYLIGGGIGTGVFTNACMKYIITNGAYGYYSNLASKPLKKYAYGGSVYNDKMYIFSEGAAETHIEIYDVINNSWSIGTSLGVKRGDFATARVGNKVYLIGGFENGVATARIDEYNLDTDSWARKTDLAWPRYGISAVTVNNDIYLIGGRNGSIYSGVIEVYNPLNDNFIY